MLPVLLPLSYFLARAQICTSPEAAADRMPLECRRQAQSHPYGRLPLSVSLARARSLARSARPLSSRLAGWRLLENRLAQDRHNEKGRWVAVGAGGGMVDATTVS